MAVCSKEHYDILFYEERISKHSPQLYHSYMLQGPHLFLLLYDDIPVGGINLVRT